MLIRLIGAFIHASLRIFGPICYLVCLLVVASEFQAHWRDFYFNSTFLEANKSWMAWPAGIIVGWAVATGLFGVQILVTEMRLYLQQLARAANLDQR